MKKIFLNMLLILPVVNADYIPYEQLKSMQYTSEAGYRSSYHDNTVILSNEDGQATVNISKKLYLELSKYKDYKDHFHKIEWTDPKNGTKSYQYTLKIPDESFMNINHTKGFIYEIKHEGRNKECIGRASISKDDGFIWCEADTLESMFKK
jgi:hypothetical protein